MIVYKEFYMPRYKPTKGVGYGEEKLSTAVSNYYVMMGWHRDTGVPSLGKLQDLDLE